MSIRRPIASCILTIFLAACGTPRSAAVAPAATPTPAELPQPSPTALPTATATQLPPTSTPVPVEAFRQGTIEIEAGKKASTGLSGGQVVVYGFRGAKGDRVRITMQSYNLHPELAFCRGRSGPVVYALTSQYSTLAISGEKVAGAVHIHQLPESSAYYITLTCSGVCNSYCTEASVLLEPE